MQRGYVLAASLAIALGCNDGATTSSAGGRTTDDSDVTGSDDDSDDLNPIPSTSIPSGNDATTPPTETPSTPTTPTEPNAVDPGQGDGKDVVSLGDSYMRLPGATQQPGNEGVDLSLVKISGRPFRSFAFQGGQLFPEQKAVAVRNGVIPGQFESAKQQSADIKTVIMSGGANDMSTSTCGGATSADKISAACKKDLDATIVAIDKFIDVMAKAGVKDLVWVGYGPTPTTAGFGKTVVEGAIDYLRRDRKQKCVANNPALGLRCHYIDNFEAKIPTRDGLHPTAAGYETVAKAVWARMQAEKTRR